MKPYSFVNLRGYLWMTRREDPLGLWQQGTPVLGIFLYREKKTKTTILVLQQPTQCVAHIHSGIQLKFSTFLYTQTARIAKFVCHIRAGGLGLPRVGKCHGRALDQPVVGPEIVCLHVIEVST